MKNLFLSALLAIGISSAAQAQNVAINTDGTAADNSAILDVKSTTKGLLTPRMTEAERTGITNPATGLIVYQTNNTAGFYYNAGTPSVPSWIRLSDGVTSIANGGTGANTASGARTNLGLGSLATASSVTTTEITDGTIATIDIADNAVTTNKINANAVTSAKILDGTIAPADIASNAITDAKVNDVAVSKITGTVGVKYYMVVQGVYPSMGSGCGEDGGNCIGSIVIYAGNMAGIAGNNLQPCNGQLLSIASNTALFSLIGITYGGNGTTNFALPNLNNANAMPKGQ